MARKTAVFLVLSFITVISKNAARLLFTKNPVLLAENRPPNEVIVTADDRDVPVVGTVYVISGTPDEFSINALSGTIRTRKTFDYETDGRRYELVVEARDAASIAVARAILVVNIVDEEEAPECSNAEFAAGTALKSINENYPILLPFYSVDARDQDIGDVLTYTLQSESSAPLPGGKFFSVDSTNGVVSRISANPLDFEEGYHTFQLKIRVTDKTGRSCEGMLTININDVNDEPPEFVGKYPRDTVEVFENAPVGSTIAAVTATDRDAGSKITYSFSLSTPVFGLDPDIGTITLLKELDFDNPDNPNAYPLLIEATDNDATNTASYTLTIAVLNVDEPPICDPSFSAGISLMIPETFPVNKIVYTILARDPDEGDNVKFEVPAWSKDTDTYFNLGEDSGVISTSNVALDYERNPKTFIMVVSATNKKADSRSCTGTLTFNIVNVNDEEPVFTNILANRITFAENLPAGKVIYQLRATDRDIDDIVRYEFMENYKGFSINEDTGDISLSFPLDYEDRSIPPIRVVRVQAYDKDRVHSVQAQLTFSLLDLNDNFPRCEDYSIVIQLPETTPVNTSLLQIKCWDEDILAPNNVLSYAMDTDDYSAGKFQLVGNEVTIGPHGLDYDSLIFSGMQFKHTLLIKVSDQGEPSLTSTVSVIVRVTRVNDFSPVSGHNVFNVVENSELNTLVGTVKFTDDDWPFNNLKYAIMGDDFGTPPKFYIEPDNGNIKVLNAIDRETQSQYTLSIQATDFNNDIEPDPLQQLKHTAVVTINIQNVNDEPPVCNPARYEKRIYSTDGAPFLQLQCWDKDSPNSQLSYAITGGNGVQRFKLQRTGVEPPFLATRQNFQYHVVDGIQDPAVFQLLIEVTDEFGGNAATRLTSTATVIVHVTPWTTTVPTKPTTTTTATTVPVTTSVLVKFAHVWNPDSWFPAILAITGFLLLLCLYALAWALLKDVPKYAKFFPQCHGSRKNPQPDTSQKANTGMKNAAPNESHPQMNEKLADLPSNPFPSAVFDGRAVDLATGRHYLFSSKTGEVQWLK